ncbi:MAG TPA: hypothetical protein VF762_15515 [Blastocatellia bacterium]|jgi:hypothetical protein
MKKLLSTLCLTVVLSVGAMGWPQGEQQSTPTQNHPDQSMTKSDGSMVTTTIAPDGTKTEVRTFKTGDIARITRTTRSNGERTVMVEHRDGRTAKLEDQGDIEQAMDASADMIMTAAGKTWNGAKEVGGEVADKTEDVADKAVDTGKKAGKVAVKGVKVAADKTEDVASETGEAVKKGAEKTWDKTKDVGAEVADKSEDVGDKAVSVGKTAASKTKDAAKVVADKTEDVGDKAIDAGKEVGDKAEDVGDKTVSVSKTVAHEGAEKTKATGNWFKRGFKRVGGFFKNMFD